MAELEPGKLGKDHEEAGNTPLVDDLDGSRLIQEIAFEPRPL